MPVVKNMKELEKVLLEEMKKKLPSKTKEYCHKWYTEHSELEEIISESKFVQMVDESLKVSLSNGRLKAKLGFFGNEEIEEEHLGYMKTLWEDFKINYLEYIKKEIFNKK